MPSSRVFVDGALEGRVAIVTGGGTNLGKAAAAELARCGASVLIAGRRADVLEEAAAEVGDHCSWVAADIRETSGAEQIVSTALERFGRLDLLLNNAGGQYMVPAEGLATKGWQAVQRLNVDGTLAMCTAAYELAMRDARSGTIINVTVSPHHGMPAMAHTGAARAAVEAITRDLASAYKRDGISVIAVALGRFDTESLRKYPAELWRSAAATVPLQRLGSARGVRLADRTARHAAWRVALGLGRDARRRARQLDRTLAAHGSDQGRRGADRGAPTGRLTRGAARLTGTAATIWRPRGRGVNGCTGAFQALGTGSTPVARSRVRRRIVRSTGSSAVW